MTPRPSPRISVNQLAIYMTAAPAKRRTIIRDAKYPPDYKGAWYDLAKRPIVEFIASGMADETILTNAIAAIDSKVPSNPSEESRFPSNSEALSSFLDMYSSLDFAGTSPAIGESSPPLLRLADVDVSVRPDFSLKCRVRNADCSGGIKLYFGQTPLGAESGQYVATMLYTHVSDHLTPESYTPRYASCQVIDVFAKTVHLAPRSYMQRMNNLTAACEEIAIRWPTI